VGQRVGCDFVRGFDRAAIAEGVCATCAASRWSWDNRLAAIGNGVKMMFVRRRVSAYTGWE
jgi:hypothetical protein